MIGVHHFDRYLSKRNGTEVPRRALRKFKRAAWKTKECVQTNNILSYVPCIIDVVETIIQPAQNAVINRESTPPGMRNLFLDFQRPDQALCTKLPFFPLAVYELVCSVLRKHIISMRQYRDANP